MFKHFPSTLKYSNNNLSLGSFGAKSIEFVRITAKQLEASRRAINRNIKRRGKVWLNAFPHIPVTSKPTEVRMGKGKGNIAFWSCSIKPGTILFELEGVAMELAKQSLILGSDKLACSTKFILDYSTISEK